MQRNMAVLEDGADLDGELALAVTAALQAQAGRLAVYRRDPIHRAAVRADRAVPPDQAFQLRETRAPHRGSRVRKGLCSSGQLLDSNIGVSRVFVKYIIAQKKAPLVLFLRYDRNMYYCLDPPQGRVRGWRMRGRELVVVGGGVSALVRRQAQVTAWLASHAWRTRPRRAPSLPCERQRVLKTVVGELRPRRPGRR